MLSFISSPVVESVLIARAPAHAATGAVTAGTGRCTRAPRPQVAGSALEQRLDLGPIGRQLLTVGTRRPRPQVGDDRRRGTQQGHPGAERERADAVGGLDRLTSEWAM